MRIFKDTQKNLANLKIKIFFVVVFIWIVLSVFDVGFNFIKSFSEAKHWLPLSDVQKRHEIYGNIYDFVAFINNHTENYSSILVYSKSDLAYYLGRYYLYPRNINVISNKNEINQILTKKYFNYVALDNYQQNFNEYTVLVSVSPWTILKHL